MEALVALRGYNFYQCFFVVPSSTDGGSFYPTLVWGHIFGVDNVHVVFPNCFSARVFLFSFH